MVEKISIPWQCREGHIHEGKYPRDKLETALKTRRLSTYCPECGESVVVDEATFQTIKQKLREP